MTQTNITFTYTENIAFQAPLEVTMSVPERDVTEMCEYFERFLRAAGYYFGGDERIGVVRTDTKQPKDPLPLEDVLDFGDSNYPPFYGGSMYNGSSATDTLSL